MNLDQKVRLMLIVGSLLILLSISINFGYRLGYDQGIEQGFNDGLMSQIDTPPISVWADNYENKFINASFAFYFIENHMFDVVVSYGDEFELLSIEVNNSNIGKFYEFVNNGDDYYLENESDLFDFIDYEFVTAGSFYSGIYAYRDVDDVNVIYYSPSNYSINDVEFQDPGYWKFTEEEGTEYFQHYYFDDGLLFELNIWVNGALLKLSYLIIISIRS